MNKMNDKIMDVQEIVFRQLKRLDNEEIMQERGAEEIARSNVISNNAQTFVKVVNLKLRMMELSHKQNRQIKALSKELGLAEDKDV